MALDAIEKLAHTAKVPSHYDKVFKDECMFCFCTALSEGGLYINLATFQAFCHHHVTLDQQRSGQALYVRDCAHRVPLSEEEQAAQKAVPDKLAIGVQGGFDVQAKTYTVEKSSSVVDVTTGQAVPLPNSALPEAVLACIAAVEAHDSANHQDQVKAWQEERAVSKYADHLPQLPCHRTIPMDPKQWKCDETGATENLWLNLSTGHIGSGRPHWDNTGGNGAAMRHFESTGKLYPLVVKLGTITPFTADVYSYADDENDMVTDPRLAEHLAHWGINMVQMEKTEKSMAELQIEKNLAYEFDKITEAGSALQPLSGPGYTGLKNLGNSCYINSVLQLLWTLPELKQRYVSAAEHIFQTAPHDIAGDFLSQFAKVGLALTEGGLPPKPDGLGSATLDGDDSGFVTPLAFKSLVGKGHPEFSSARQQDAQEYFAHLVEIIAGAESSADHRLHDRNFTSALFEFGVEARIQCLESGRVSYKEECSTLLSLDIPLEAALNKQELQAYKEHEEKRQKVKEKETDSARVIPKVPLSACLEKFAADEIVEGYNSAFLGKATQASKRVRFATLPPYLLVQLKRYYVGKDWTPKKLEVLVDVPQHLALDALRSKGPQDDELLQPSEEAAKKEAATAKPDGAIVAQLVAMGFSENGSKRAAVATGNQSVEGAMEWVFSHMEDPDFNDPIGSLQPGTVPCDPESVAMIATMGFSERQATAALLACAGQTDRAGDWLLTRMDDLEAAVEEELRKHQPKAEPAAGGQSDLWKRHDGPGEYELIGFISHMGSNTACGHYVCHIKKDGRWAIYNDEKVAVSEVPPLELGYMYLYKRVQ